MTHPVAIAFRAVRQRLTAQAEPWAGRVYQGIAPAGTARPYVVFAVAAASERNRLRRRDAEIVLLIKVVAGALADGLDAADRVGVLLNDAGDQDGGGAPLLAGAGWRILTVTQEQFVQMSELIDGVQVFHAGAQFRFVMEGV